MSNIINYNRGETIATGFVRPKVTSLFFDKIWIPESLINSSFDFEYIPRDVLIKEEKEITIQLDSQSHIIPKEYYQIASMRNTPYTQNISPLELYIESFNHNKAKIESGEFSDMCIKSNRSSKIEDLTFHSLSPDISPKFKYSKNRNNAILVSSESFNRKYHLHITPIFHDLTEFEKEALRFDTKKIYGNKSFRFRIKRPNTFLNKDVLAICIQDFPLVKEEELSWEQVLDFRSDRKRIEQLRKFTNWSRLTLENKTPEQVKEILEDELEKYKMALKEHGVITSISAFSTIVSSASSIASFLSGTDSCLFPLLSIVATTISFASNTYFSSYKNRNYPMAYIYNLTNDI